MGWTGRAHALNGSQSDGASKDTRSTSNVPDDKCNGLTSSKNWVAEARAMYGVSTRSALHASCGCAAGEVKHVCLTKKAHQAWQSLQ